MSQGEQTEIDASEVELSTDELVQLSSEPDHSVRQTRTESRPVFAAPVASRSEKKLRASKTKQSRTGIYVAAALVVIACSAAVLYAGRDTAKDSVKAAFNWRPLPNQDPEPVEEPVTPNPTLKPVRIRNAFDPSEIFEFPPGTSRKEAREAVAQILLERAAERQSTTR